MPKAQLAGSAAADPDTMNPELFRSLIEGFNMGVVTVDARLQVLQWNRFMETHTGLREAEVVGRRLLACFPELPAQWLEPKLRSVFALASPALTSWRQMPYLFCFNNRRLITGGTTAMRQDCAFLPLLDRGRVKAVSIVLMDATDAYESQTRFDAALAELAAQSERDTVTGVFNRRKLETVLSGEFARVRRYGGPFSLFIFDIDRFKRINDTWGHLAGDAAIRHVCNLAVKTLRNTDIVGRYGGDELVALLPEVGLEGAEVAAERVRSAIAGAPALVSGNPLDITVSVGVSDVRADSPDGLVALGEADRALYQSKRAGRNRVTVYSPQLAEAPPG